MKKLGLVGLILAVLSVLVVVALSVRYTDATFLLAKQRKLLEVSAPIDQSQVNLDALITALGPTYQVNGTPAYQVSSNVEEKFRGVVTKVNQDNITVNTLTGSRSFQLDLDARKTVALVLKKKNLLYTSINLLLTNDTKRAISLVTRDESQGAVFYNNKDGESDTKAFDLLARPGDLVEMRIISGKVVSIILVEKSYMIWLAN